MPNNKKEPNAGRWERMNVQVEPAQYDLLNKIKVTERLSLGEVSRIMFDIAICVLLDDTQQAKNRAQALNHLSPEDLREYAKNNL